MTLLTKARLGQMDPNETWGFSVGGNVALVIFIVVPCILVILKFFSPTNAHFIEHIKC
jgi:hypothetical protein